MMTLASSFSDAGRVFTPADIIRWDAHAFGDDTRYERVTVDGRDAIHAVCEPGAASGLAMREGIDLKETPVLEWEWRVDRTFAGLDESRKSGDDYAARLYAVDEHPFIPWRARSINYVWASEKAQGSHWANPYQSRVTMIAVRSGSPPLAGEWRTERRNLPDDFRRYDGREPERIDALALMTDCDDAGQPVEAWYGEIRLLAE
ncbi:MAG: DUF3047 domain-containing protein [Chromatocurvus sp.]